MPSLSREGGRRDPSHAACAAASFNPSSAAYGGPPVKANKLETESVVGSQETIPFVGRQLAPRPTAIHRRGRAETLIPLRAARCHRNLRLGRSSATPLRVPHPTAPHTDPRAAAPSGTCPSQEKIVT